jgi:coproporphyrinogen III oxidase-like Fe-S oxidoreductase
MPIFELENYELRITNYVDALKKEIDHYAEILTDKEIKTLYIWGGTPSKIGADRIIDIIDYIWTKFNLENLAEFSIELNPNPAQEVLDFVKTLNKKYTNFPRLRYSFGIQSFDDEVLQTTWRAYSFVSIADFLRDLVHIKPENVVFNFDFIAFGKFNKNKQRRNENLKISEGFHDVDVIPTTLDASTSNEMQKLEISKAVRYKQLRTTYKLEFFSKFLESWYVDSISLYTLEGIKEITPPSPSPCHGEGVSTPLSKNWRGAGGEVIPSSWHWTDEEIMEEFTILKDIILNAGYHRYEISNFAKRSKASIHNMVYRNMEPYIWLGLSASSFMPTINEKMLPSFQRSIGPSSSLRRTNTWDIKQYLEGKRIDEQQVQTLNESDLLIEEFFLRLRTSQGISDISKFTSVLIPNYQSLITNYQEAWLIVSDWTRLQLTDEGMNVYNTIITDLLQKI